MIRESRIKYDLVTNLMIPAEEIRIRILINVEGQKDNSPGYDLVTRGVYYGARRISAQKGVEFVNSDYDNIKKVYSIWICFDSKASERNTITEYSIRKNNLYGEMPDTERYDLLSVVFIRLGGEVSDYESSSLQHMLMTLFSETMSFEDKAKTLSKEYGIQLTDEDDKEVGEMGGYGQYVYERGIERGQEGMIKLFAYLKNNNRLDEYEKALYDNSFRMRLMQEMEGCKNILK